MQLSEPGVVHLDSHVVCWLYAGMVHLLSDVATSALEARELRVSPWVLLEIERWHERGLVSLGADAILLDLSRRIGLSIAKVDAETVLRAACAVKWTEDPFDRGIVAHATLAEAPLVTKDAKIHAHFSQALW